MRTIFPLALLLLLSCSANAEQPVVEVKPELAEEHVKVTHYSINDNLCFITFSTHYNDKSSDQVIKYVDKSDERCKKNVAYDQRLRLYDQVLSKILESKFFENDKTIEVGWGPIYVSPTLVCRLIRYSSTSEEWHALLQKFGNKSVSTEEVTPFHVELGELVRKAGLLKEVEGLFQAHGYRLKDVRVGGFFSESIKKLRKEERECVVKKPKVQIVPNGAVVYLLFERIN